MRTLVTASVLGLAFCVGAAAQNPNTLTMEKALPEGGTVALTVNVGDVKVLPSQQQGEVRLEVTAGQHADHATMASWVRQFNVAASRAAIEIHMPKDRRHCGDCYGNSSVVVYVPERSDLEVKLGVGELRIQGVRGNKELENGVGDLRVGIASPNEYGHIETHTRIGDIHDPFSPGAGAHGFLGKTEDFELKGDYHLKATVGIGDIYLYEEGKR